MHLSAESRKSLDVLREDLASALREEGWAIAATTDARAALRARGMTGRGSLVVEVEDPLPEMRRDAGAGGERNATTWRIAVYETDRGTTRLSTLRPTHLVDLLGRPEHAAAARRVEDGLASVLRRAAGRPEEVRP